MNEKDNEEDDQIENKPNFAALDQEYGCDYRTAKIRYYEELNK